ncbi:uncharacterized protein B0I36DRAFT_395204 [Microdochium trichocladiopsis]|uniref:tyrosinase n=1 Tax=Microdochium trichocladiopsis TaxID=1682393 RepID=A0A9P8XUP2_9PEZI|nr:uncharacterized protein B0I36DRAFT_395204 [Microdochium trichocladiopsis]KAH7018428.1 hypothetical protein B0I36DRAFT_395204 [Microdochium trichocladiopsis]
MAVIRKNIRTLSKPELDNLVKAFAGIQALPPNDPNSFFMIAGYHGEPFRGAGYGSPQWWGGYCNHGNVLFPTWHRAYLFRLEQAMQSIVPGVALPYWDETEPASLQEGIPGVFLTKQWKYADGTVIDNPLYSYKFQAKIIDRLSPIPDANYTKPSGYQTVRYPFSGLVGTADDAKVTAQHNSDLEAKGQVYTDQLLNGNIVTWLNASHFVNSDGKIVNAGVKDKWAACLNAPNYTAFSNTTSAQQWNDDNSDTTGYTTVVPLESPHNSIHLAVGGFEVQGQGNSDQYAGANGDMGENDTAAFDPIFYFHHCFVDLAFALWQHRTGHAQSFDIIHGYPGTNSVDSQGPTPGVAGGTWLNLDSPLDPFKKPGCNTPMTSRDVMDITKLGYSYQYHGALGAMPEPGGAPQLGAPTPAPGAGGPNPMDEPAPVLAVSNINRANIGGSFMVTAWAKPADGSGDKVLVGTEAILSRWHVSGCANCQNHLEVRVHMPLHGWSKREAENMDFEVKVHTRQPLGDNFVVFECGQYHCKDVKDILPSWCQMPQEAASGFPWLDSGF